MSTHDYVIDNQSAPAFRADLNNVLAAIASQNSSGTAPTVTFANMIWYDTTNNQIKKRNEANSAWIVLGTLDETAGTFTPSGERALATQVQAEAGTDNATLMTPLRSAQAIAALATFSIADGSITTAKLADSAVTGAKLGIAQGSFSTSSSTGSVAIPLNTFAAWSSTSSSTIYLRGGSTSRTLNWVIGGGGSDTFYWRYFT